MRRLPFLAAAVAALAGCPIPQPLGDTSTTGSTVGPRIVFELLAPQATIVDLSPACPSPPVFPLSATLLDENRDDPVDARWFVNYRVPPDRIDPARVDASVPPSPDVNDPLRALAPFPFAPLDYSAATTGQFVVELVASNGFYPIGTAGLAMPNRTPRPGHDTQVFRWVFRYVASGGSCGTLP